MELNKVENEIISIYENENKEKLVNARELHKKLKNRRKFSDWMKQRIEQYGFIENEEFIKHHNFVTVGNLKRPQTDYYIKIDMAKELCMVENNETGKKMRKYFIEVEKRYHNIIENPNNIFDFMRLAINQIEQNTTRITNVENRVKNLEEKSKDEIRKIKKKIDVIISKDYCLASDIAEQLGIYSENKLPHSNLVGAIARVLGYKISYKHYYEDENIAIVPDISKGNGYYQVYYKPKAVKEIIEWFDNKKIEIQYKIIYERSTKNGKKGEVREQGYKIENVCYKVWRF